MNAPRWAASKCIEVTRGDRIICMSYYMALYCRFTEKYRREDGFISNFIRKTISDICDNF